MACRVHFGLVWGWVGVGRVGVFRRVRWDSGGASNPSFFHFCRTPPGERFLYVLRVNLSVGDKFRTKTKLAGGAASEPVGGGFGLSRSFWACLGLGGGGAGLLLGTCVFVVVALWFWCVLRSACAFPAGFGRAWGGVWPGLAQAPVCCLGRRSESRSSLDDLPSKHDKCVFSPSGPKGVSGWPPIPIFFEVSRTIPN